MLSVSVIVCLPGLCYLFRQYNGPNGCEQRALAHYVSLQTNTQACAHTHTHALYADATATHSRFPIVAYTPWYSTGLNCFLLSHWDLTDTVTTHIYI